MDSLLLRYPNSLSDADMKKQDLFIQFPNHYGYQYSS